MTRIGFQAHAKINLDLRILGVRPDGYHELRTILQTLDLHDTLTFVASRGEFLIRCGAAGVPTDRTNLIWRAAAALWSAAGRLGHPRGVTVTLEKRIPVQGGLGGGSADAAATLLALSRFWRIRDRALDDIARSLGADVPFFLCGGTALGVGRGDEIYPLAEIAMHHVVLVIPPFGVATADAYAWADAAPSRDTSWRGTFDPSALDRARLRNDFEPVVESRHPIVGTIRDRLLESGAVLAALSGSGSTVFGLFLSPARARSALRACRDLECRVVITRTIGRRARR